MTTDLLDRINKIIDPKTFEISRYHMDLLESGPFAGKYETQARITLAKKETTLGPLLLQFYGQGYCDKPTHSNPSVNSIPGVYSEVTLRFMTSIAEPALGYINFVKKTNHWGFVENDTFARFSKKMVNYKVPLRPELFASVDDICLSSVKKHIPFKDIALPVVSKMSFDLKDPSSAVGAFAMLYFAAASVASTAPKSTIETD